MAKVYSNIQELNKMIDKTILFENATDYIFNYYYTANENTPSLEYLKREYKRLGKWFYKDTEQIQHIEKLRLTLQYLKDISLETYLIDWRKI